MKIREIEPKDAVNFIKLMKQVEKESPFMLFEADERNLEPQQQKQRIEVMKKAGNSTIFLAEENNQLIGYLLAVGGSANRTKHSVYIVIGISSQYRGLGIGTKLFEQLEQWAFEHQIHRLELTVVTRNEAGVRLYEKMGFVIEGTKKHSLSIEGEFVDEYYMAKLL